jgi:MFS family permease
VTPEPLGPNFAKLWTAATFSAFGTGLASIATPLLVAQRTGNPLIIAGVSAASWLPWLLFALPSGVVADRVDRRRLMIALDLVRLAAVAVLGVALAEHVATLPLILTVLVVISTGEVFERVASNAFIPAVVPTSRLERANGWLSGGTTLAGGLLSGPVAGLMFRAAASLPFLVNGVTYALSAVCLALIAGSYRARPAAEEASPRSMVGDIREGLRFLFAQRMLRTMAVLIGLLNVTLTAALAIFVLVAKNRLHVGSVGYGVLFTAMALGGVVGAAFADRIIKWVSPTWTIRVGLLIEAGLHLVLATSHSAVTVGVAFAVFGVHGSLWGVVMSTLRQRVTPADMQGRVSSATLFVVAGGNFLGAALGGALAGAWGLPAPYWVGFGAALVVSATTWRVFDREHVRAVYDAPPAASAAPTPVPVTG